MVILKKQRSIKGQKYMSLNIMTLEAQLLAEIEERTIKLEKIRGVSPKLQELEALLKDCKDSCDEFGMQDLFLGVLGNFTTVTAPQENKTPKTITAPPQENTTLTPTLSDKEVKAIRIELKSFLGYEGQRLNDATAKNLLIEKLETLGKTNLLSDVNLDDKNNFLVEAKKLITLAKEEIKEDLTVAKEETLTTPINPNPAPQVTAEEVNKEDGLNPADVIKSALVQNKINGYYGTVERDGALNGGALVRYPQETLLTPLSELKLIQPAIITTPTPINTLNTPVEEIKEEEEVSIEMSLQEKMMWDALLEIFDSAELSAMATDKETVEGFNLANGTNLTVLPIADLYEYTTGNPRIS